jgi:hypothetical protein
MRPLRALTLLAVTGLMSKSKLLASKNSKRTSQSEFAEGAVVNKKQEEKKHVAEYFVNNYDDLINEADFQTAGEKVVASNMLGSPEFYKRNLNALMKSKPEKALSLYRDMTLFYDEAKKDKNESLLKIFSSVITSLVFVEFFNLMSKEMPGQSELECHFKSGYIYGLEFIMTVLEDDFLASKGHENLFNQIVAGLTTTLDLHDVITQIGTYFLKDAVIIEHTNSRKVLMRVFNLFFKLEFGNQYVAFPSLMSQFVRFSGTGGINGPENLRSFLENIEADTRIKIINYVLVSRHIYKLTEKKDEKVNFTRIEDLSSLFNLFPKNRTNTNKEMLELFFILIHQLVLAIIPPTFIQTRVNPQSMKSEDDNSMEVETKGNTEILQQLEVLTKMLNTWRSNSQALFVEYRVHIFSILKHLEAVKKELENIKKT